MASRSLLPRDRIDRATLARELGYAETQSLCRAHRRGTLVIPFVVVAGRAWYSRADVRAVLNEKTRGAWRRARTVLVA